MLASPNRPQWRRIYRQTLTLIYKNLLIFYKAPISTITRALIFPIVLTVVLCELIHINASSPYSTVNTGVIANSATPIKDLGIALKSSPSQKLVFVRNGISNETFVALINGIIQQPGMQGLGLHVTDDPNDLYELCKQSLQGTSSCFAAVIFISFNETNVEYSIALDSHLTNDYSTKSYTEDTFFTARLLPLQWAVDSQIGKFSPSSKPSQQAWSGYFYQFESQQDQPATTGYFPLLCLSCPRHPIPYANTKLICILKPCLAGSNRRIRRTNLHSHSHRRCLSSQCLRGNGAANHNSGVDAGANGHRLTKNHIYDDIVLHSVLPRVSDLLNPHDAAAIHEDFRYSPAFPNFTGWWIYYRVFTLPRFLLRQGTTCGPLHLDSRIRPGADYISCNLDELFSI